MTCYVDVDNGEEPYESCALNINPDDCEIAIDLLAEGKANPRDCKYWKEEDCFKSINVSQLSEEIRRYKMASEEVGFNDGDDDLLTESICQQNKIYNRIKKLLFLK